MGAVVDVSGPNLVLLRTHPLLISNDRTNPLVAGEETEHLSALLRSAGAEVTVAWQAAGHELTESDITTAREWLTKRPLLAR